MIRAVSYAIFAIVPTTFVLVFLCGGLFGQLRYDCPSQVPAVTVESGATHKIVEMLIPVSIAIEDRSLDVKDVKVQVRWNRNAFPVVEFAPRTLLQSSYDGAISIEKKSETNYGIGVDVGSDYLEFLTPSLNANVGKKDSETQRFSKLPPQELLVSSGTTDRGTGVYFDFKQSQANTLEGSRDLIVAFEVPVTWRGGVLQTTFTSTGKQKKFGSLKSDFKFARVFVLPTYLKGDDQARQFSYEFVNSEMQLRKDWRRYESSIASSSNQFNRWFGTGQKNRLPDLWVHHLIQSGSDVAIEKYKSRLPKGIAFSAEEFVDARNNLLALGR